MPPHAHRRPRAHRLLVVAVVLGAVAMAGLLWVSLAAPFRAHGDAAVRGDRGDVGLRAEATRRGDRARLQIAGRVPEGPGPVVVRVLGMRDAAAPCPAPTVARSGRVAVPPGGVRVGWERGSGRVPGAPLRPGARFAMAGTVALPGTGAVRLCVHLLRAGDRPAVLRTVRSVVPSRAGITPATVVLRPVLRRVLAPAAQVLAVALLVVGLVLVVGAGRRRWRLVHAALPAADPQPAIVPPPWAGGDLPALPSDVLVPDALPWSADGDLFAGLGPAPEDPFSPPGVGRRLASGTATDGPAGPLVSGPAAGGPVGPLVSGPATGGPVGPPASGPASSGPAGSFASGSASSGPVGSFASDSAPSGPAGPPKSPTTTRSPAAASGAATVDAGAGASVVPDGTRRRTDAGRRRRDQDAGRRALASLARARRAARTGATARSAALVGGLDAEAARYPAVRALRDRRAPGRPGPALDHVLVGPSGVLVARSRGWSGTVRVAEDRLFVRGLERTRAVDLVAGDVSAVRSALAGVGLGAIPVTGLLLHDRPATAGFDGSLRVRDVVLLDAPGAMLRAVDGGVLGREGVARVAAALERALRPA